MFALLHILAVVLILGFLAYKICRLIIKWVKNIHFLIKNNRFGKAVWLLTKGIVLIAVMCGAVYLIEYIAIGLIAAFVIFMHINPKTTTILYTSDFLTIIKD